MNIDRKTVQGVFDSIEAFTDPEGRMPADTGEFRDLAKCLITLRAALAAPEQEPVALTEANIDEYLEDYEMCGEDEEGREGCYIPNENDKALIKDAMMGFTSFTPYTKDAL